MDLSVIANAARRAKRPARRHSPYLIGAPTWRLADPPVSLSTRKADDRVLTASISNTREPMKQGNNCQGAKQTKVFFFVHQVFSWRP